MEFLREETPMSQGLLLGMLWRTEDPHERMCYNGGLMDGRRSGAKDKLGNATNAKFKRVSC